MAEQCIECNEGREFVEATEEDPRTPPLAEGVCLCKSCAFEAYEELVADLEFEVITIREHLVRLARAGA